MSLAVAIPLGAASSVVYGVSIVVQHRVAHTGSGEVQAHRLLHLLRNPIWLLAIAGDFVGFVLSIGALSTGPVVIIQPLVVLMLPVALLTGTVLGGPRPGRGEYLAMAAVVVGLSVFLAIVERAGHPHIPDPYVAGVAMALVLALALGLSYAVRNRGASTRGAMYGAAAGACFGTLGVLVNLVAHRLVDGRISSLVTHPGGVVSLVGIAVLGIAGIVLTQMSFQVGALAATLPANLSTDPIVAVVLGVVLLREHLPHGPWSLLGYVACLSLILYGTVRLAAPAASSLAH